MEKKIKISRIIQMIAATITLLLVFTFYYISEDAVRIPNQIVFLPYLMYTVIIAGIIVEYIYKQKPIVRTTILSLAMFSLMVSLTEGFNFAATALIIFAIPYTITMIFVLSKGKIVTTYAKLKTNKTLPEGFFSKKESIIQYTFWVTFIIILIILFIIFKNKNINYLYLFLFIPFAIIILFIITNKTSTLRKLLNYINNDLNYEKFIEELETLQKTNLHPETYNYLEIIKVNYMFVYNIDASISIFENLKRPTNKQYQLFYDVVEIKYLIRKQNYELALEKIEKINPAQKAVLQNFYKVLVTTDEMLNIENIYLENNKLKFNNVLSVYLKMHYYETRSNHNNAKLYAKKLIGLAPGFKEYITYANKILND